VKQNEQQLDGGSRWLLYHGTTTYRLKSILKDDRLTRPGIGDQKISLTTERSVAEYFSNVALHGDKHDHPSEKSAAVILVIDGEKLLALGYNLVPSIRITGQGNAIGKTRSRVGTGILSTWTRC
jgi:hypothetical protein